MKMPYRVIAECDSYEDSKKMMTLSQKFISLIHTNSYTKFITGLAIIVLPILLSSTLGLGEHPNLIDETKFFQLLRSHIHTTTCSFSKTKEHECKRVFLYGKYFAESFIM